MKFLVPLTTILASLLLVKDAQAKWQPKPGLTWNYLLGVNDNNVILNRSEQVLTIDLNKRSLVPKLHSQGKKVICYFSGGTIEPHRDDKEKYYKVPNLVFGSYTKWNEQWLDIRMKDKLQPLIENRMKLAVDAGCDAIEVDCLGAYNHEEPRAHGLDQNDSYVFAKWLAQSAHKYGIAIGLKNVATLAPKLVNDFDFAVVESCSRSVNVCGLFKDFPKQGKAVFTIHYGDYGSFSNQVSTMVKEQKGFGYTCIFNNSDQLKTPSYAYNCDTGSTSNTSGNVPKQDVTVSKTTTTTVKKTTTVAKVVPTTNPVVIKPNATTSPKVNVPTSNDSVPKPSKTNTSNNSSNTAVNTGSSTNNTSNVKIGNVNSNTSSNTAANTGAKIGNVNSNVAGSANAAAGVNAAANMATTVPNTVGVVGVTTVANLATATVGIFNTATSTATFGLNSTPVVSQISTGNNVASNNKEIEVGNATEGHGNAIGYVAAAGGVAAAAAFAFIFLKKNDKFTDLKRNLSRRLTTKKNKSSEDTLDLTNNYRYEFSQNYYY